MKRMYIKSSIKPRGDYLFFVVLEGELDREEGLIEKELISKGLIIWKRGSPVDGLGHLLRFELC